MNLLKHMKTIRKYAIRWCQNLQEELTVKFKRFVIKGCGQRTTKKVSIKNLLYLSVAFGFNLLYGIYSSFLFLVAETVQATLVGVKSI